MKSKNKNPFGKELQKFWDRRYELFSRFDEGIETDETGLYSATPEKIALHQAKRMNCRTVIDGFSGIGGNAIAFAKVCEKVYAIEQDKNRIEMAKHNAKIYGVEDKIIFISGNFFKEIPNLQADGIFIDPQWKLGPNYKGLEKFRLSDFEPNVMKILNVVLKRFDKIAIKVPVQFDFSELASFDIPYKVENNKLNERIIFKTIYFYCRTK